MESPSLDLDKTHCFSSFFLDYMNKKESLNPFYSTFPETPHFESAIESKKIPDSSRSMLVNVLEDQYQSVDISPAVSQNIALLKDSKTYTITTGHQLNIFTGPLYFIYKIVTAINTCKSLKKIHPEYNFVPVYWMASEDHDFDEINHFYFEGEKHRWDTNQTGAVGRFDPSELKKIAKKLPLGAQFFSKAYSEETLANAARSYVNHLFKDEGLVVIDADDKRLKKQIIPVIADDLFLHSAENTVSEATESLKAIGYKPQVHAREINFFYLEKNLRERIDKTENGFKILNTDLSFSDEQMKDLIHNHPERFSPNVILRPLYQEIILPNIAYIGGPSEIVYWLQLKSLFRHFNVSFPVLMPRNFALLIPIPTKTKWEKVGLAMKDVFLSSDKSFEKWVLNQTSHSLSYNKELQQVGQIAKELKEKAHKIDPTLTQHIEALHTTFSKKIEKAEKKIVRAEKRKHEDRKLQIEEVKNSLFPNGILQERRCNFLEYYLKDPNFISKLLTSFDPFKYKMYLLDMK